MSVGGDLRPVAIPPTYVKVKNTTGSNLARGKVLQISGTPITTLKRKHLWVNGITPTAAEPNFCVLVDPIRNDKIGVGQVSGTCLASVNITNTAHTHARVSSGSTTLQSSTSGQVRILHKPSGTGIKECLVLLGASNATATVPSIRAKADTVSVASGDIIQLSVSNASSVPKYYWARMTFGSHGGDSCGSVGTDTSDDITVIESGIYLASMGGTIYSATATAGSILTVNLVVDLNQGVGSPSEFTWMSVSVAQIVDSEPYRHKDRASASHPIHLRAGDIVYLKNAAGFALELTGFDLSLVRITESACWS